MAGPKQIIDIPIAAGLNTKADPRAMQPPGLAVCEDVQFDELGGVQTRPQYQAITDSASNTIADIRKIVEYEGELVAFTKDKIWSYASGDGLWTQRSEYLAVEVTEKSILASTGDQYNMDRAQLGGVVTFCWTQDTPSGSSSFFVALDEATGAVKKRVDFGSTVKQCRLTATTTKIHLTFIITSTTLTSRAYDPADLTYSTSTTVTVASGATFDVDYAVGYGDSIFGVACENTQYQVFTFSSAGAATVLKTRVVTADDEGCSIGYNTVTDATFCICYSTSILIKADLIDVDGSDGNMDISLGVPAAPAVNQIACAFDGVDSWRVFWTSNAAVAATATFATNSNTVNDSGTAGTAADLVPRCHIASRAFLHDGSVFVWLVFAQENSGDIVAQLQNTYYLYRADGMLVAKAVGERAGGYPTLDGHLPSVRNIGGNVWAFAGELRNIVPLGGAQKGYSAKSPQDIRFEFDSSGARRTAQLGRTLYIAGGQLSQFDGENVVEVGFHAFPYGLSITAAAGALTGTFSWLQTFSWYNSKGEFERSTTASIYTPGALSTNQANIVGRYLNTTLKTGAAGEISCEFWRTVTASPVSAPFYMVSSRDPSSTGDNKYVENDPAIGTSSRMPAFVDDLVDTSLVSRETYPESGGAILESLTAPAASIILATQDRIILAGIPGHPYRMVYSRLRGDGEIASFNDALFVDLPPSGGEITAIGFLNETLIVFKASAVYALPGDGFDNAGGGQNYGPARLLDNDVGAISAEGVVLTPKGILFKSNKGWFVLTQGWNAQFVGVGADAFDDDTIVACHSMDSQHQVRCVSSARTLIWDYLVDAWFVWTPTSVSATMWNDVHHYVNAAADGVLAQAATYSGSGDLPGLDIETAWNKTSGIQGFGLIRRILILGEYLGACDLRIRVAYNYKETSAGPVWVDDKTWTVSPTTVNGPLQLEHGPSRPKCESIKIRITAQAIGVTTHPISQAINLTALSLEVATRQGAFKALPAAQKQ